MEAKNNIDSNADNNIEPKEVNLEKATIRDNLYGRIDVSVKTMDRVIIGLICLILISIVLGIIL